MSSKAAEGEAAPAGGADADTSTVGGAGGSGGDGKAFETPARPAADDAERGAPPTPVKAAVDDPRRGPFMHPVTQAYKGAAGAARKGSSLKALPGMDLGALAKLTMRAKKVAHKHSEMGLARRAIDERSDFAHPDPLRMCVCVDGSQYSEDAFKDALELMEPHGHLTVVHAVDPRVDQATLPPKFRAKAVEEHYQFALETAIPIPERFKLVRINLNEGESLHDGMCRFVHGEHFQLVFVGMQGRRSPTDSPSVLGSTADYSLRHMFASTAVIKTRKHPDSKIWVVGVDGSLHAHNALLVARRLAHRGDEVHALNVHHETAPTLAAQRERNAMTAEYERDMGEYADHDRSARKAALKWVQIELPRRDATIAEAIVGYAEEHDASYLVVGADGVKQALLGNSGRRSLGSVSDSVVLKARCNVIVTDTALDLEVETGSFDRRGHK